MEETSHTGLFVGLALVGLMLLGGWLTLKWKAFRVRTAASKAAKTGLKAEREAEKVLKKLGYTLLQRQPPGSYWAVVDGEPMAVKVSGDLLVELKGKTYMAEVKTGKAAKLDNAETRRQMLEYQLAFPVDGILLVDMDDKKVRTIRFPLPKPPAPAATVQTKAARWVFVAAATGLAIWLLTRSSQQPAQAGQRAFYDKVGEHEPVLRDDDDEELDDDDGLIDDTHDKPAPPPKRRR